ncbi:muellerian-inhibiting factor [Platysternon megacephalum]|uniref:Muellerian-inhibiting factor n=1 Tax=Platysternon megacephalum TaxID=55544 RepID=A0A4D9DJ23_9SAUR|nr:muellerian-inhibiting factor [Platysternon megacephalum]
MSKGTCKLHDKVVKVQASKSRESRWNLSWRNIHIEGLDVNYTHLYSLFIYLNSPLNLVHMVQRDDSFAKKIKNKRLMLRLMDVIMIMIMISRKFNANSCQV